MKKILSLTLSVLLIISSLTTLAGCFDKKPDNPPAVEDDSNKVHLVVLAGQSGARGKALVEDLPEEYKDPNVDVDILADGLPMGELGNIPEIDRSAYIDVLEPGYGDFPSEFGPEIGMGQTLASVYPKFDAEYKTVIVKYTASGSTFTDHWYSTSLIQDSEASEYLNFDQVAITDKGDETGPLTNNLYALVEKAISELTDLGYEVVIDGMAFVHGEQDAKFDANMEIYEKALACFIDDFRAYFGDEDMPVVITEALTNSAKYSNSLRSIQEKVATRMNNVSFVETGDLYTNTFEPWHFGAMDNIILGNRIAAELISYNDTREIKSIDEGVIDVPYGVEVDLPAYVKASFTNYYAGYVKASSYSPYDCNKLGEQEVEFRVNTSKGIVVYKLTVNVKKDIAYVDGQLTEYKDAKENLLPDDLGKVYVIKGEDGLYIAANIYDTEIWTDGENWHRGDMGQKGNNDDFIVYVTDGDVGDRKTICLSAANLLRVYDSGVGLDSPDVTLEFKNLVYNGKLEDYAHRVSIVGTVNGEGSGEMMLEIYISYEDLGIEDPDAIKLCFNYNNITLVSGAKTSTDNYFVKGTADEKAEENIDSYFAINELIK